MDHASALTRLQQRSTLLIVLNVLILALCFMQSRYMPSANAQAWSKVSSDAIAPAGSVMYFNLASCPSGWLPSDGTNGTLDLRGEFLRGWDAGRGIDSGRVRGSFQEGTWTRQVMNDATDSDGNGSPFFIGQAYAAVDAVANWPGSQPYTASGAIFQGGFNDNWIGGSASNSGSPGFSWVRYRPRNVALLVCQKQ